jgi:hypothetical protein
MDVREIEWEGVDWMHMAQEPVAVYCENSNKSSFFVTGGEFLH